MRLVAEFERVVNLIFFSPQIGAVFRGTQRRYFQRRFPYSVIYQITQEEAIGGRAARQREHGHEKEHRANSPHAGQRQRTEFARIKAAIVAFNLVS